MPQFSTVLNTAFVVAVLALGYYSFGRPSGPPPVTEKDLRAAIAGKNELVLLKFGTDWYGPCQSLDCELDFVQQMLKDTVSIVRLDVANNQDLARRYRVTAVPHIFLLNRGEVIADRVGFVNRNELRDWVKSKSRGVALNRSASKRSSE